MVRYQRVWVAAAAIAVVATVALWWNDRDRAGEVPRVAPTELADAPPGTNAATLDSVLELAADAHQHLVAGVDDYTARFVQQERDSDGVLGPETVMEMKVQTRHRGGQVGSPMRVYLKFEAPDNLAGREVIWGEDLHGGKLVVHETGLLGLVPIYLDPNGIIAMRGQRYPISEVGLTKLIEKLIERGEFDRGNPSIRVTRSNNHRVDSIPASLIRLERTEPSGNDNDFSIAEILFDPERKLILSYRSFGWPIDGGTAPLLESYEYHDIKTNVGLTEADFDPQNPAYGFP